jgi:menaquinol-cytochrome c reductase iron-sulfur subunit
MAKAIAVTLGSLAYAVPVLGGIAALLNPPRQKREADRRIRVASLDALPEDGTPRKVSVVADRTDGWNRFRNEPIGAVLLRRTGDGQVKALNVRCPHLGCSIEYKPAEGNLFCPCHKARFDLSGARLEEDSMSPRDLDELDVEVVNGTEVWVVFQDFKTGTSDPIPEA